MRRPLTSLLPVIAVIAHIEHDIAIAQLHRHALGGVVVGGAAGYPSVSSVLAISDVRERKPLLVASLRGETRVYRL